MHQPTYIPFRLFLEWSLLAGVSLVGVAILLDLGVLGAALDGDVTHISQVILIVLFGTSLHAGYRCWWLSCEAHSLFEPGSRQASSSVVRRYLDSILVQQPGVGTGVDTESDGLLAEVLAERLRGAHQVGWFFTGVVVKLGLLGTVVGFVLMLQSVSGLDDLDTADIKELMQQMTLGMGVAMNTTLVGLVSSLLLGLQYLMLDRAADTLLGNAVETGVLHTPVKQV